MSYAEQTHALVLENHLEACPHKVANALPRLPRIWAASSGGANLLR